MRRSWVWAVFALVPLVFASQASEAWAQTAPPGGTFTGTGAGTGTGIGAPKPAKRKVQRRSTTQRQTQGAGAGAKVVGPLGTAFGDYSTKPPAAEGAVPAGTYDAGHGFSFQFNYTSESAGNPFGGIKQGARYADQVLLGVDVDVKKAFGLEGGVIHVIGTQRDGNSLANDLIGNSLAPQEIYDGSENTRLTILTYEQTFLNDHLDIEFGRLPAQGSFLVSPLYCNFQNVGVCGSPEIVFADTNFTFFPTSTYGARAKFWFNDRTYVHVGAFEVQPNTTLASDHGLNFGINGATGAVIPVEFGYSTTAANDLLPRNYSIGAVLDASSYTDPTTDVNGGNTQLTGLPGRTDFFRSMVYGRFDQTVYRPDPSATKQFQIFGLLGGGTSGRQTQDFQIEAGALYTGILDSRPYDTLGFVVTDQHYSSLGLADIRTALAAEGLNDSRIVPDETLFELNYGIQVSPAVRLTPNIQYILNPDQLRFPGRPTPIADTLVIGGKASIDLFTLAGLAKGPGSP